MWPFGNKNKKNGFTFSKKRVEELEEAREHILTEYSYIDSIKSTKNRVIRLSDKFSDAREIIAFYDLKPEKCVVTLGYSGNHSFDLNVVPKIHKDIAGVFAIHEKHKKVCFPDGISDHVHLYNVSVVDKNGEKLHMPNKHFDLFNLPTKTQLIRTIFGSSQRILNTDLEKSLQSLGVIKEVNSLYFYYSTKASKQVRENINDFRDTFFQLKEQSLVTTRVYPSVPDEVSGGRFDWDKAHKQAKEGVEVGKFSGRAFYWKLSEGNNDLQAILNKEQLRIKFISDFPTLEEKLSDTGYTNGFGELGKYAYVAIDRARYDFYDADSLRGSNERVHCFWDSLLRELEDFYNGKFPKRYSGNSSKEEEETNANKTFYKICDILTKYEAISDDDMVSYVNLNSSISIEKQIKKGTTFTIFKYPAINSQNEQVNGWILESVKTNIPKLLLTLKSTDIIVSDKYRII